MSADHILPIAVDAMGGDKAPGDIVTGARQAAADGIGVLLVGRAGALGDVGDLPVLDASEVIEMGEDPAGGVRRKKDSSLVRCAEAVRDGKASAMVSAGNTGATMASALLRMGRIKGVARPAIATAIPVPGSTPTVLLDAGANAEVSAEWLVQFAQMGSVFSTHRFGLANPRVGLLSIGEEPGKGDQLRKDAYELLAATTGINFVGNVEGRDIMTSDIDVVVADGFTGNVVLKSLEGALKEIVRALLAAFNAKPEYADATQTLMPALLELYAVLDPETYGGAMLLGVDGVCIIGHGSSSSRAIHNAIRVGADMARAGLVDHLRSAVGS